MLAILLVLGAAAMLPMMDFSGSDDDDNSNSNADHPDDFEPDPTDQYSDVERPTGTGTPADDQIFPAEENYTRTEAGAGDDLVVGSDLIDLIRGEEGNDTLMGGAGDDSLVDFDGTNQLFGGEGNDSMVVNASSTATGGAGHDTFTFRPNTEDGPLIITDFEDGEDTIGDRILLETGLATGNEITGQVWEDGTGQDFYFGGTLIASVHGGQNIVLNTDTEDGFFIVSATGNTFTHGDSDGNIQAAGTNQTIDGGAGDDSISSSSIAPGDTGADVFLGGDGNDTIRALGPEGTRFLDGEGGTFSLTNAPELDGGEGDDILIVEGSGVMTGGAGEDIFGVEYSPPFAGSTEPFVPVEITDFQEGVDTLYIEASQGAAGDDITVAHWDEGVGTDVFVGDVLVARLTGVQLAPEDVQVPFIDLSTDLLGHH